MKKIFKVYFLDGEMVEYKAKYWFQLVNMDALKEKHGKIVKISYNTLN